MKRFKLGFRNRSVREQLAICRRVVDCAGKLPDEKRAALAGHPVETLVADATQADARVEALRAELRAAIAGRNTKLAAARAGVYSAALAIHSQSGGDAAALLAAGLEIEAGKSPVGLPAAPGQVRAAAGAFEGAAHLRWKRPVRRCTFIIQMTSDPAATSGWKQAAISLRQSCEVTGLESGMKYWFRVAATNAHGQGPWSGPVGVRVR